MTTPQRAKYLAGISEAERKVRANIEAEKAEIRVLREAIKEIKSDIEQVYLEYYVGKRFSMTEYVNIKKFGERQIGVLDDKIREHKLNIKMLKKQLSMSYKCQTVDYPSECFAIFYPQCGHEVWTTIDHMGEIRYCPFCGVRIDIKRGECIDRK